jgi:ADP-ribose pyrophosphatase YjhB (NUDIX family)
MLPRSLFRILSRMLLQPYFRLTRGQTLGVRGVVRDEEGRFLLIRHSYAPGWMFPGGGVDHGESLEQAAARELREETGVSTGARPRLISLHTNFKHFKGDHVALFELENWQRKDTSSLEIAEVGFFSADDLPEGTTGGTKRRIAEIVNGGPAAPDW